MINSGQPVNRTRWTLGKEGCMHRCLRNFAAALNTWREKGIHLADIRAFSMDSSLVGADR